MKIAVLQMTSGEDPEANLETVLAAMDQAKGADMFFTPEVTNCVSFSRNVQNKVLERYSSNAFKSAIQDKAKNLGLWTHLGSISVKSEDSPRRFINRSVLIDPDGEAVAQYDKIHMFDVTLSEHEVYRESDAYQRGGKCVLATTPDITMGLTICYDLRFPHLFRKLAQKGATLFTVPSAFSVPTGKAHWHTLLRARAIETGCFIVAAAQSGEHPGSQRKTYGHSLVVDPWGQVLLDCGTQPGLFFADLDLTLVDVARRRMPSLFHDVPFSGPT